jgi:ATP-dependent DNA helicase RecG
VTNPAFAEFVRDETRAGRTLELDDLMVLRAAAERGMIDRWSAATCLQLSEDQAAERLVSIRQRGYLVAHGRGLGTAYRFARHLSDLLRGPAETDRDMPLEEEALRMRIQTILRERGRLTNAEIRRLSNYSRTEVLLLMRPLLDEGLVSLEGRGRGAHYVPGRRTGTKGRRAASGPAKRRK